jgi:hypothetical protein
MRTSDLRTNPFKRTLAILACLAATASLSITAAGASQAAPGATAGDSGTQQPDPMTLRTIPAADLRSQGTILHPTGTQASDSTVAPDSATGCNGAVCIYVDGVGLHINYVETYTTPTKHTCAIAAVTANDETVAFSNPECAEAGDLLLGIWNSNRDLTNGTRLCVEFVETISSWNDLIPALPGKPCETVHR